eukprot:scaffold776_cov347-Pavlova_lutheri.AAC.26
MTSCTILDPMYTRNRTLQYAPAKSLVDIMFCSTRADGVMLEENYRAPFSCQHGWRVDATCLCSLQKQHFKSNFCHDLRATRTCLSDGDGKCN